MSQFCIDWRRVPGRYIKDPRLGHRLGRNYPGGEISDAYWDLKWLGTDQDGLIHNGNPQRDYDLADKSFTRIFVFGGSTVMGLGVHKNTDTLSSVLERTLQQFSPNVRVANCGVGAYMSWHELTYLATEMIGYEPDLIVVLDGHNDFGHSTWGNKGLQGGWIPNTHRSLDDIVTIIQEASRNPSTTEKLIRVFNRSPFGKFVHKCLTELRGAETQAKISNKIWGDLDYKTWRVKPESVSWYLKNLKSMIGIAQAHKIPVIALLQPQLVCGNREKTSEEVTLIKRISERMPPIPALAPQWLALAQPALRALKERVHDGKTVWVEDASDWFDEVDETVYHDWVHYNKLGQHILALKISEIASTMLSLQTNAPLHPRQVN